MAQEIQMSCSSKIPPKKKETQGFRVRALCSVMRRAAERAAVMSGRNAPRRRWQHQGRSARSVLPQGAFFLTPHSPALVAVAPLAERVEAARGVVAHLYKSPRGLCVKCTPTYHL